MRNFELMLRQMEQAMEEAMQRRSSPRARVSATTKYDPREYDGYRREVVDGEVTEYYLDDGEWVEAGSDDGDYELNEDGLAVDISGKISTDGIEGTISTLNNGVLSVEFVREDESEDDE